MGYYLVLFIFLILYDITLKLKYMLQGHIFASYLNANLEKWYFKR